MKTIQEELGGISYEAEVEEMQQGPKQKNGVLKLESISKKKSSSCNGSTSGRIQCTAELSGLFLELPWMSFRKIALILKRPKTLDRDHYGLEEVKKQSLNIWRY